MNRNLLFITSSYPYGKVEGFLNEEFDSFIDSGFHVMVMPLWPRGKLENDPSRFELFSLPLINIFSAFSCIYHLFRYPSFIRPVFQYILMSLRSRHKFRNIIIIPKAIESALHLRVVSLDHIHVHWGGVTSSFGMLLADLMNVEWSFTCHRWDIYIDNMLALKSARAKFVRFISRRGLEDALSLGVAPDSAYVINMGVSLTHFDDDAIFVLPPVVNFVCAANLIPVKGHDFLIRAIRVLVDRGYNVLLHLYGDGVLREHLASLIASLDLQHVVLLHGFIRHSDLLDKYRSKEFDIFVLPSVELANNEHEGIPVSLMEAMAHNIPVFSTLSGSIPELFSEFRDCLVNPANSQALADVLCKFLSSPKFQTKVVTAQKAIILSRSVHRVVQEYESLLCLDSRGI